MCHDKGSRAHFFWEKDCSHIKAPEALQISEAAQEKLKEISDEGSLIQDQSSRYKKPKSQCPTLQEKSASG